MLDGFLEVRPTDVEGWDYTGGATGTKRITPPISVSFTWNGSAPTLTGY